MKWIFSKENEQCKIILQKTDGTKTEFSYINMIKELYEEKKIDEAEFEGDFSEGEKEFTAIAVVGNKKDALPEEWEFCTPCGVCRQVMLEFVNPETFLIYSGKGEEVKTFTLKDLLPESFAPGMVN